MTDEEPVAVLLDENVDRQVLGYLRAEGHGGAHVVDALEPGVTDAADITPYARERSLVIVTKDTDFLGMDETQHAGVLFVENHGLSAYEIATGILEIIDAVPDREHLQEVFFVDAWV